MLTLSTTANTFELPPAGPQAARCSRIIDLGSQASEYEGKKTMARKLLVTFTLAEQRSDGEPFTISRRFTASLAEKSALRAFLQQWRGRALTEEDMAGFDLRRLLNAPALLNLIHTSRSGKDYANIASISPLPKGMSMPELSDLALTIFDIDDPGAPEVLENLSEGLQATITASPEWQARLNRHREEGHDPFADDAPVF